MYLQRKIDSYFLEWKRDKNRKPLIVKGARQVGKTESIMHFVNSNYASVIYINFVLEPKYKSIANDGYDVDSITRNISLIDPAKKFVEGDTAIVFDEIQEYPDIATTLKSFKIDGRYDVICSGSMLGINYRRIHSNSVGYKTDYNMYSMDFEEFLWAKGYDRKIADEIFMHMIKCVPFSETEMNVFFDRFLEYCVTGGMPAIVSTYMETGLFTDVAEMQRQILFDYEEDARKYAEGLDQGKIISVLRSIPSQLAKENKKFQFSTIKKNARSREYMGCIEWLIDAGIVVKCECLAYPELPLKGNTDESRYKLYYPDTGLLMASLDEEAQDDVRENRNLGVYKGAIYENFAAEALTKQGIGLFYYRKEDSKLEEDFVARTQSDMVPIEIKAGDNRSKSLTTLIGSKKYEDISWGIKFGRNNIGFANGIYTFPYFCLFLLKRYLKEK